MNAAKDDEKAQSPERLQSQRLWVKQSTQCKMIGHSDIGLTSQE